MNLFERWLTLWVFLCIAAGIALGQVRSSRDEETACTVTGPGRNER